ncbi:MAG TPA: hypothetical protein RMH99_20995 [Sandaracinaceae bacterium LLY-WYZ-13_1]|nr:hypothetical protein [Sandaracinaceae bacterium LLY-WYZ-13_1]
MGLDLDDPTRVDPDFVDVLASHDALTWERSDETIYVIRADLRIAYVNPSWRRFALGNGGSERMLARFGVGARLIDAIHGPLRDYYEGAYRECLREGQVWAHDYECSTAEKRRFYHQTAFPLGGRGLLVVNSLREERPFDEPDHVADRARYLTPEGLIVQCGHCRRVKTLDDQWHRVSAWVERQPGNTSHGLCPHCLAYYWR